jgi:hypothetical protein
LCLVPCALCLVLCLNLALQPSRQKSTLARAAVNLVGELD